MESPSIFPRGTVGALIGPNGAGENNDHPHALRHHSAELRAATGRWIGCSAGDLGVKKRVAYVPDDPPLFETLTVWEHLKFIASAYSVGNFEQRAEELLQELNLEQKKTSQASELSRGMRQKVAIACAYLHSPSILFFDEPLTGLDPAAIRLLKQTMVEKAEAGATVLVSSHLLALVEDICRHMIVLRGGKCLFSGTVEKARNLHPDTHSLEDVFFRITEEEDTQIDG